MKKLILFLPLWLAGCAALPGGDVSAVRRELKGVVYEDGINPREAAVIAQNFMVDHHYDRNWNIHAVELLGESRDGRYWSLTFPVRKRAAKNEAAAQRRREWSRIIPAIVHVAKEDGQVVGMQTVPAR